MRPDRQALLAFGVKPVAAVLLVVLAFLAGFTAVLQAPSASAESGTAPQSESPTDDTSDDASESPTDAPTEEPSESPTEEPSESPTEEPSESPTEEPSGEPSDEPSATEGPSESEAPVESDVIEVDDAIFRWGINNQSNARSHNPGAFNFFSAGVADPGRGGVHLLKKHWSAKAGKVVIQKWLGKKRGWKRSVWEDWFTTATGERTGIDSNFSLHNVVIRGGTGTINRAAGTAEISWKGTFTVVYYSGNTLFTVTDPVLRVADGKGEVTAALGGWASERDNMSQWEQVDPQQATIATLPKVNLGKKDLTATPAYEGVTARGFSDQVTNGRAWGAFPQSMLDFLEPLGIAQFWYSTGLTTDHTKVPLPLTVSYDATEAPAPTPTDEPTDTPTVTNPITNPPPPIAVPAPVLPPLEVAPIVPSAPAVATTASQQRPLLSAVNLSAAVPVSAPVTATAVDPDHTWWVVGALLLLASLLLSFPSRPERA